MSVEQEVAPQRMQTYMIALVVRKSLERLVSISKTGLIKEERQEGTRPRYSVAAVRTVVQPWQCERDYTFFRFQRWREIITKDARPCPSPRLTVLIGGKPNKTETLIGSRSNEPHLIPRIG